MSQHLTVQRLLEESQARTLKLSTEERRRVLAWLMSTQPSTTNAEYADWLQVSEGQIRKDKIKLREQMAKDVREDDIALVIADILWDLKRQIQDLEQSKTKTTLGSKERRMHCESISELRLKTVKALQDLGYLPKNLGSMVEHSYHYTAVVTKDGNVDTRPSNLFDEKRPKQLTTTEEKKDEQVIEAEFTEVPPARQVEYGEEIIRPIPEAVFPDTGLGEVQEESDAHSSEASPETV